MKRPLAAIGIAGALGVAAWQGAIAFQNESSSAPAPEAAAAPNEPAVSEGGDEPAATVSEVREAAPRGDARARAAAGETPMAQRVAVIGLLNKRNGIARDITLKPGEATRVGDVIIRLRACEMTAPWENQKLTGAFVQTDVRGRDQKWRRVFSGWLFKESPSLNAVEHPIYDVWPKSCAMRHPETGPDTISASTPADGQRRSRAKKSAEEPTTERPATTPSAESSSET